MTNELLFFIQAICIVLFALAALRLGQAAVTTWITIQVIIANLFVLKQITLFGFDVTASDVFIIGSLLGFNFLQEYFGKGEVQKATLVCFFFMLFFAFVSQLHLLYHPSTYDTSQPAFLALLSSSPRLLLASMVVFFVVQQFDVRFFAFLKEHLPGVSFAIRAALSLIISQFLDTTLFTFVGLYGIATSLADIILISFTIKLAVIFCFIPFVRLART